MLLTFLYLSLFIESPEHSRKKLPIFITEYFVFLMQTVQL